MATAKKKEQLPLDKLASIIGEQVGESLGKIFGGALGAELGKKVAIDVLRKIKAEGYDLPDEITIDSEGAARCPPRGGILSAEKDSSDEPKIIQVK